jgi:hypothetical protein
MESLLLLSSEHSALRTRVHALPYKLGKPTIHEVIIGRETGFTKCMFTRFEICGNAIANTQIPVTRVESTFSSNIKHLHKRMTGEKVEEGQFKYTISLIKEGQIINRVDYKSALQWDLSKIRISECERDPTKWGCTGDQEVKKMIENTLPWTVDFEGDVVMTLDGKTQTTYMTLPGSIAVKNARDLATIYTFYEISNFHQKGKSFPVLKRKGEVLRSLVNVIKKLPKIVLDYEREHTIKSVHVERMRLAIELLQVYFPQNEVLKNTRKFVDEWNLPKKEQWPEWHAELEKMLLEEDEVDGASRMLDKRIQEMYTELMANLPPEDRFLKLYCSNPDVMARISQIAVSNFQNPSFYLFRKRLNPVKFSVKALAGAEVAAARVFITSTGVQIIWKQIPSKTSTLIKEYSIDTSVEPVALNIDEGSKLSLVGKSSTRNEIYFISMKYNSDRPSLSRISLFPKPEVTKLMIGDKALIGNHYSTYMVFSHYKDTLYIVYSCKDKPTFLCEVNLKKFEVVRDIELSQLHTGEAKDVHLQPKLTDYYQSPIPSLNPNGLAANSSHILMVHNMLVTKWPSLQAFTLVNIVKKKEPVHYVLELDTKINYYFYASRVRESLYGIIMTSQQTYSIVMAKYTTFVKLIDFGKDKRFTNSQPLVGSSITGVGGGYYSDAEWQVGRWSQYNNCYQLWKRVEKTDKDGKVYYAIQYIRYKLTN